MVKVKESLVGQVFGRLTVLEQVEDYVTPNGQHYARWFCECACPEHNRVYVTGSDLKKGNVKSCGCLRLELTVQMGKSTRKHGESHENKSRLYGIWVDMKQRCTNEKHRSYKRYGGRGISVCDEWFNNYLKFKEWAIENGYNDCLTIDRIDNDKGYEPNNCCWSTMKAQGNNRSTNHIIEYSGQSHTISEWSQITGINYNTLRKRLRLGWDAENVLTTPVKSKGCESI